MNIDDDTKRFIIHRLKWSVIYVGLGIVLVVVLPFPYDLASVLGLCILKRYGRSGGIRDLFSSLSSSMSANNQSRPLKYYCMNCGKEHRQIACPNCGSKMKRVG
jgi:hypothetical protein